MPWLGLCVNVSFICTYEMTMIIYYNQGFNLNDMRQGIVIGAMAKPQSIYRVA